MKIRLDQEESFSVYSKRVIPLPLGYAISSVSFSLSFLFISVLTSVVTLHCSSECLHLPMNKKSFLKHLKYISYSFQEKYQVLCRHIYFTELKNQTHQWLSEIHNSCLFLLLFFNLYDNRTDLISHAVLTNLKIQFFSNFELQP